MPNADGRTSINVRSDTPGSRTVAVSGVLDGDTVTAVIAVARDASGSAQRLVLDLLGVRSVEGDSVARLARALRDLGVELDVVGEPR